MEKTLRLESDKRFPLFHRTTTMKDSFRVCFGEQPDEITVKRRAGKPAVVTGLNDRSRYKDRHARIIIVRPENILHLETGYIYADCLS